MNKNTGNQTNNIVRLSPLAASIAALCLGASFQVLAAEDAPQATGQKKIEVITTIGTRVSGRMATESPAPVDIIGEEQLAQSGATELGRALQIAAPSFNFSSTTVSDGSDIIRPATLRGLGPDQVLVLVNGKRRHQQALVNTQETVGKGSAGYDINAIPLSAVKRVEVLRDGAAAQYGSDAIAGVINIVLKDSSEAGSLRVEAGQTYEGDGENLVLAANKGFALGDAGFINLSLEYRDRGETNRAGPATLELTGGNLIGKWWDENDQSVVRLHIGDAESKNLYAWVNGGYDLSDTTELYFFGGYSSRDGESAGFFRGPGSDRTIPELYPEGFLPQLSTNVDDTSAAAGLRGDLNEDWKWDVGAVWGRSEFSFNSNNSANVSWYYEPKPDNSGIYGETPTSAHDGTLIFEQTTVNADINGSVDWGANLEPLYLAFGLELRQDAYQIVAGDPWSYSYGRNNGTTPILHSDTGTPVMAGIQGFPGFGPKQAVDQDRSSYALYADAETNLTDELLVGAAVRYEHYQMAGDNVSGKLSSRYEFNDSFSIRGTVSSGFRAPGVQQINYSQVLTNLVNGELVETGTVANSSPVAAEFGIENLDVETSLSYSIGMVAEPIDDLKLSLDIFQIDIDDRIVISDPLTADIGPEVAAALAANRLGAAQFFTNSVDTRTRGLDLVATYDISLDHGADLKLAAALSLVDNEVKAIHSKSSIIPAETLFGDVQKLRLEEGQPGEKLNLSVIYQLSDWEVALNNTYYGEVSGQAFGSKKTWSGKWLTDLSVSYQATDELRLTIGGTNIFDVYPDKWGEEGDVYSQAGFTYGWETLPFGINGGAYYAKAVYSF
ncbi:TonB-dependent receptor plug domain-containing protein [Shewanella salipaludis]|uniref:TonB-dependent receptor plug domain-containing protein n=1 Tax=Shewanella salipaludis TaxID=2723052 RepID=UPI001FCE4439|nr:TonB-dependent receptor [Shewanella salipaludis]